MEKFPFLMLLLSESYHNFFANITIFVYIGFYNFKTVYMIYGINIFRVIFSFLSTTTEPEVGLSIFKP